MRIRLAVGCLTILAPLILLGCGGTAKREPPREESSRLPTPQEEAEWRAAQADDIYTAVFRYRFQDEFPDVLDEETFYIAVDDNDPSERLLELLSDEMPVVEKMSDWGDPPGTGTRMGLWRLAWKSNEEVTVEWGTRIGRCVFNTECRVVLGADGWRVADVRTTSAAMLAR